MKLTYMGHSAFYIEAGGCKLLIDPFLKNNPQCSIEPENLPHIDYILVTHGHSDHLGDTIDIARMFSSTVICNYEISLYLDRYNIECHSMHIGGSFEFAFGKVKMTPALHGSSILDGNHVIPGGNPGGFIISSEGKNIYHAGDTGLSMEMQLLRDAGIDYALLPIGGNFTMDIPDASKAVEFIQPKVVIPMHYDTFPLIKSEPERFAEAVSGICGVEILKPMQCIEI